MKESIIKNKELRENVIRALSKYENLDAPLDESDLANAIRYSEVVGGEDMEDGISNFFDIIKNTLIYIFSDLIVGYL